MIAPDDPTLRAIEMLRRMAEYATEARHAARRYGEVSMATTLQDGANLGHQAEAEWLRYPLELREASAKAYGRTGK